MDAHDLDRARETWAKVGKLVLESPDLPARVTPERLLRALSRFVLTLPATDVAVGIPCKRDAEEETLSAAMHLCHEVGLRGISVHSFEIANNREYLVAQAIKLGCDRLLFLDSDTVVDGTAFWQLMRTMDSTGAAVVAGLVKMRDESKDPGYNAFLGTEEKPQRILKSDIGQTGVPFPVLYCGVAVALLDLTQIAAKFPQPRFARKAEGFEHWGEDRYFCKLLKHYGLDLLVDPKVTTFHVMEQVYGHKWDPGEDADAPKPQGRPMIDIATGLTG